MSRRRLAVVFVPHKVGSKSIAASLLQNSSELQVMHTHSPGMLNKCLFQNNDIVFMGVRHPFWLRLSAFFQDICGRFIPGKSMDEILAMKPEEIYARFEATDWSLYGFVQVQTYFQALKDKLGIDVLSMPFGSTLPFIKTQGRTRDGHRVHCVIYKLEELNQETFARMCRAVNLKPVPLLSVNIGDNKVYADLYRATKKLARLSFLDTEKSWYDRLYCNSDPPVAAAKSRSTQIGGRRRRM